MKRFADILAESTVTRDELDGRVYGWIPGVVTDLDTKLMRVKARIGKMGDGDSTDWLIPMGMGSVESLPEVNDPVGVFFGDGDPNRGAYFYFPQSTTKARPLSEPGMLGATFVGMFNYLVTQLNQLRTDFNTLASQAVGHTHLYNPGPSPAVVTGPASGGTPGITKSSTTANAANKGKASDGSVVSDKASSEIVLSKRTKFR